MNDTPPPPKTPSHPNAEQQGGGLLGAMPCSPSFTPETTAFLESLWNPDIHRDFEELRDFARKMERERDEARRLHAYANAQRKAADNDRMNAEETAARLRLKVDELLKHGMDACEYTDGWDDALLKVRDQLSPENA